MAPDRKKNPALAPAPAPAQGHSGEPERRQGKTSVLLIEPDRQESELYADLVREVSPCDVDIIRNVEGLEWVDQSHYHLILLDVSALEKEAPGDFEALWLLERIKQANPTAAVVLITESATVEEAVEAMRLGAEDYLKKPFNPENFKLAIKRSLDRREVFAGQSAASDYAHLLNACQMISASLDPSKVLRIVQGFLSRELGSKHSAIYRLEDGKPMRVEAEGKAANRDEAMEDMLDIAVASANPFAKLLEGGRHYLFSARAQLTPALFVFHFKFVGGADYFCVCLAPRAPGAMEVFEGKITPLRAQLEVTGKNIKQYMGVRQLAYLDDATGLYNTRFLNRILDREIEHSRASGRPFAVLFIDADRFKAVNDKHGHLVGTRLLNALGAHIKTCVRDSDTVFRYGGDEFVAILGGCDLPTAQAVAERIRKSVEERAFLEDQGLDVRFTVSIGVALFPEHADSKKSVIEMADQAMYGAKKKSRNAVIIASPGRKSA